MDSSPGPVSFPKMLFKEDYARRLEAERDAAADRGGDADIAGQEGADDLIGDTAGDHLADQGSEPDHHWFFLPRTGDDGEIVVTGRKPIPDSQKYVLVGGKYHLNPNYAPPFDISLEQAIAIPPLVGMAGALAPEVAAAAVRAYRFAREGYELKPAPNWRIAPFGNRTGDRLGKWPHYHRSKPGADGKSPPGQGIGRHRPWQSSKKHDESWRDRF